MPREHEAKILNVDPGAIEAPILASGGRHAGGPVLMRRIVYDVAPGDESRSLRLRASGDVATAAVKQIVHDGIDGTEEIEVRVDDFDVMSAILSQLGLMPRSYRGYLAQIMRHADGARIPVHRLDGAQPADEVAHAALTILNQFCEFRLAQEEQQFRQDPGGANVEGERI
jgi:adenylate cyclase class 2